MTTEIRYDLDNGIEHLDLESTIELVKLTDHWSARARLRTKWASRTLVGIPFPSDTRPESNEEPFPLTRRLKPLTVEELGNLIRNGKTVDERIAEYEREMSC